MELKNIEYFTIYCSTGCTCCSSENHFRGPFSTKEIAENRILTYRKLVILASQYSATGRYSVKGPFQCEQLPDGRIIGDDHVYKKWADDETPGTDEEICYF